MTREGTICWVVKLDGEEDGRFATRREARGYACWLRRHPEVRERRRFADVGHARVHGHVRVEKDDMTGLGSLSEA